MRFDHAVIAVRDLERASALMRDAGFVVSPGGSHVGMGTENAIVRFGVDYLELISVSDEDAAVRASARSRELAAFVKRHEAGLVGYALAPASLATVAERLRSAGRDIEGPTAMRRMRPDGVLLEWELLIPDGVAWRRPWPFFIAWSRSDAERLRIERPDRHPNGATAVSGVAVAVDDLASARRLYDAALGGAIVASESALTYLVRDVAIDVVGPDDPRFPGLERGPGPFSLQLRAGITPPKIVEVLPSVTLTLA
ncbi:MAG TPA: VOC family protein [Candidatus Limnocylindria bacterium]|nr:VOC family protein [Candidatus Limnocylindria bacterium]